MNNNNEFLIDLGKIFELIEINDIKDMEYSESFCALMELEEDIPEMLFHSLFREMDFDRIRELTDEYLEEIITGIADDCIDFYTFISTYKRNMRGMVKYCQDEDNISMLISELYKFREWYQEQGKVQCVDMQANSEEKLSICQALVLGRLERLSMGSYSFDYSDAMDLEYDEYEYYLGDEREYEEDYDEEYYEKEENDPAITLIDRDNPVIDDENYDNFDYEGGFIQ